MKDLKELAIIIKDFCSNQIASGKTKSFEDLSFPCIPISRIPLYLNSIEINWKEYGFEKLPDLINNIEGLNLFYKGVPYVYLQSDKHNLKGSIVNAASIYSVEQDAKKDSTRFCEPKDYEIRLAYRRLITKPEEWVSIRSLMTEVKWHGTPRSFTEKYKLQFNPKGNLVRVHNISRYEIIDDIYFDPEKNSFPSNVDKLREMALDENWDDNGKRNKLLDNYLCYTYARVKYENKIAMSEDMLHACWNTGLVDFRYESIFCYMTRKDVNNRWVFKAFCIKGEDQGKDMGRNISKMPENAVYFKDNSLLCQPTEDNLSVDRDHIIREHPSRLPFDWLKQSLGEDVVKWKEGETSEDYDKRICDLLPKESSSNLLLQTFLKQTIDESVKRCQWNYKTAIPYYDPISQNIGWFLPLCIRQTEKRDGKEKGNLLPFAALVVTKGISGRFQGETIYRLSWAYRCARLVCRPDSDWLTPLFSTDEKIDTDD